MANTNIENAKKTSELATTSNVASTDRLVVLYNAISNAAIANGTPQARTITINNLLAANSSNWSNTAPTTISEAINRLAIVVKSLNGNTGA